MNALLFFVTVSKDVNYKRPVFWELVDWMAELLCIVTVSKGIGYKGPVFILLFGNQAAIMLALLCIHTVPKGIGYKCLSLRNIGIFLQAANIANNLKWIWRVLSSGI
jgi:hypothetical protein